MEGARICFGDFGYKETSNRMIAESAGVTTGTIYHYFQNKQDLFLAVQAETQRDILEHVKPCLESETFADAIAFLMNAFWELFDKHNDYAKFNAVVRSEVRRNSEISAAGTDREWRRLYHALTDLGISTGEIDHRQARTVRNVLSALVFGITHHATEATKTDHLDALEGLTLLLKGDLVQKPRSPK